jgi:predicted DNA-binding transcriptional regulator AlpA
MKKPPTLVTIGGQSLPAAGAALEKVPSAARRMGCSVSQFYRIAKRDGLLIVKVGERASAVVSAEVDAWVQARITAASAIVQTSSCGRPA